MDTNLYFCIQHDFHVKYTMYACTVPKGRLGVKDCKEWPL
jgi:hypothetical protein